MAGTRKSATPQPLVQFGPFNRGVVALYKAERYNKAALDASQYWRRCGRTSSTAPTSTISQTRKRNTIRRSNAPATMQRYYNRGCNTSNYDIRSTRGESLLVVTIAKSRLSLAIAGGHLQLPGLTQYRLPNCLEPVSNVLKTHSKIKVSVPISLQASTQCRSRALARSCCSVHILPSGPVGGVI